METMNVNAIAMKWVITLAGRPTDWTVELDEEKNFVVDWDGSHYGTYGTMDEVKAAFCESYNDAHEEMAVVA